MIFQNCKSSFLNKKGAFNMEDQKKRVYDALDKLKIKYEWR